MEESIVKAIGQDGFQQLELTIDDTNPGAIAVKIKGPDDLKAKAHEALNASFGKDAGFVLDE
jgi:hypothetical protein